MILSSPWWLLGLIPVAAVALWAIHRPARELAVVAGLALWREALDALDPSARRRARRLSLAWLLLLAGALAGVLAAAGPVLRTASPARRVALVLYPSAELAGPDGAEAISGPAARLLNRLAPADRVQVVLPVTLGGAGEWLSPRAARGRVEGVAALPVPAEELTVPEPDPAAQHVYTFAAAGTKPPEGAARTVIALPASLPPVTIDAFAAEPLPDGRARIFAALRNHTTAGWQGTVAITSLDDTATPAAEALSVPVAVPAGGRTGLSCDVPTAAAIKIELRLTDGAGLGASAYLVRREADVRRVALLGGDEPLLRRFVAIHPTLDAVGDVDRADLVIANGVDAPPGRPALVIDPPAAPPGWRRGEELTTVLLDGAAIAPDPVTADLDLSGVAVRRVRPWLPAGPPRRALVAVGGAALIVSTGLGRDRRVYVAFDLAEQNTNLGRREALVVLLENATFWLSPPRGGRTAYVSETPLRAGPGARRLVAGDPVNRPGPLPWPGLYLESPPPGSDAEPRLRAVGLTGLRSGPTPTDPAAAVDEALLPPPQRLSEGIAIWPWLAAVAAALWLAGWAARAR